MSLRACEPCAGVLSGVEPHEGFEVLGRYEQIDTPPMAPHLIHHHPPWPGYVQAVGRRQRRLPPPWAHPWGQRVRLWPFISKPSSCSPMSACSPCLLMPLGSKSVRVVSRTSLNAAQKLLPLAMKQPSPPCARLRPLPGMRQACASKVATPNTGCWWLRRPSVHPGDYTRKADVIDAIRDAHRPDDWLWERDAAQQNHGRHHQSCLAPLARDGARVLEVGDHKVARKLKKGVMGSWRCPGLWPLGPGQPLMRRLLI